MQKSINIPDGTGLDILSNLNNALQTLASNFTGSSAPATTYAGQLWIDTSATSPAFKLRTNDNTAWITIGTIVGGVFQPAIGSDLNAASHKVINIAAGVNAGDAVNKGQLDTRSDTDLSNISTVAKNTISMLGLPSSRYIDLTLGATGTTYTAPANGWISFGKTTGATSQWISFSNITKNFSIAPPVSATTNNLISIIAPVEKGDQYTINYTTTGATNNFRCIYAEGAN